MWKTVSVVVIVVATAVAGLDSDSDIYLKNTPRQQWPRQQCSGYCKAGNKFELLKGRTYVYQYQGVVSTGVEGAGPETSAINVTAEVHLRVEESPCELILLVHKAQLFDSGTTGLEVSPRQNEFKAEVERWPLRLSYVDGRVDQLCPAVEEHTWTLDFKRAILSAMQNSMSDLSSNRHLHERDVSGTCDTTYTVAESMFGDVEVLRRKQLHSCSGRGSHSLGLSGVKPSSTALVRSEQVCRQKISARDGRHIARVDCHETHLMMPFSNGKAGLTTQATLTLVLVNIFKNDVAPYTELLVNRRTSLKGEFSKSEDSVSVSDEIVKSTLEQLTKHSQYGVDEAVPQLFDTLVTQMSSVDEQLLVKIFDNIKEKRARQYFLDALPLVGTTSSVEVIYQIYAAHEVSRDELDIWLSALTFHKQPTMEMLTILDRIMQEEGYYPQTWLSVSAVVHAYCLSDSDCQESPAVQKILTKLSSYLGNSCHTENREQQEAVVAALKAVGNAGVALSTSTLDNCINSNANTLEVRLAALSATRRLPCKVQEAMPMVNMFPRRDQDPELRIAAYLAAMQCPTATTMKNIKNTLTSSEISQVTSFIWTHLTNLQESRGKWENEIHQLLRDSVLKDKHNMDFRKFSRNYEMSVHSDILKMGATAVSNAVFSPQSYLPRSANLNLTVDLFGEAVNLFEVGTRLEGFESVVEDIFSPNGYFPDESIQTVFKNMKSSYTKEKEAILSLSNQFGKKVKDEPQGMIFARVLGNELYLKQFSSLNNLIELNKPKKYTGKYFVDILKSIFDHKTIDYSKSFKIIDSQNIIPTVVGFPLRVKISSTAIVGLEMKTSVDLQNILRTLSGNLELLISPSAVVEINGRMTVDAVFAQACVETKAHLNTNTRVDIKAVFEKGKMMDVTVNLPRDKMEVVDAKSAVYVRRRDQKTELGGVGEMTQWDTCSGLHVPTVSGMRACSVLVVRNASDVENAPYFPLTGSFHYALQLQKTDTFQAYKFHLEHQRSTVNGISEAKFLCSLDTPGSKRDRTLLAELVLEVGKEKFEASLELKSPLGRFYIYGDIMGENTTDINSISNVLHFRTLVGNTRVLDVEMVWHNTFTDHDIRYGRTMNIKSDLWNINCLSQANFQVGPSNDYNASIWIEDRNTQQRVIIGTFTKTKEEGCKASASINTQGVDLYLEGFLVHNYSVVELNTTAKYRLYYNPLETISTTVKLDSNFKNNLKKLHLSFALETSKWAQYNSQLSWKLTQSTGHFNSCAELQVGKSRWRQQLTYHNSLQRKDKHLEIAIRLHSPTKGLDYRAELLYKLDSVSCHAHVLGQLNSLKKFVSSLDYRDNRPEHLLELELASPWKRVFLKSLLLVPVSNTARQEISGDAVIEWGDRDDPRRLNANVTYQLAETALSTQHHVVGTLTGDYLDVHIIAEWSAKAEGGLIRSNWNWQVSVDKYDYKANASYIKDSTHGKHDLTVGVIIPDNSYMGEFSLTNNVLLKNITARLDLEKSLYFTSQLERDEKFDMQLFWDYLHDRSQSVWVQYKGLGTTEVGSLSMPGHYASLTVDRLGQGLSSMNITAVWGESEGSANNSILLSTYWLLDTNTDASLPTVYTQLQLITPFIGYERQSFEFSMNASAVDYEGPVTKKVHVSTQWQDQFVNLNLKQVTRLSKLNTGSITTFLGDVTSSLEIIQSAKLLVRVDNRLGPGETSGAIIQVDALYNKCTNFSFRSKYAPSTLDVSVNLEDIISDERILMGTLYVTASKSRLEVTLPESKYILLESDYGAWPWMFAAKLKTSTKGYEIGEVNYHIDFNNNKIETKIFGKVENHFALFSALLEKSVNGYSLGLNTTSSSSVPDVSLILEHDFHMNSSVIALKELASIALIKSGEPLRNGKIYLSFIDNDSSPSTKKKRFESIVEMPGHFSTTNYSYERQIKLTDVEVQHYLTHKWNTEKTEMSLVYEGLSFISGLVIRNDKKEAEVNFQRLSNKSYKTYISLPGSVIVQHSLTIPRWTNFDSFFSLSTPRQKLVIKILQTTNAELTQYSHKSTVYLNNQLSYIDLAFVLDPTTDKIQTFLFKTSSPWNDPLIAEYNMIVSNGESSRRIIELNYNKNQNVKIEFDIISTESQHITSFSLFSPFCKQLEGSISLKTEKTYTKGNGFLMMDDSRVSFSSELFRNTTSPKFEFSFNNTDRTVIYSLASFDITDKGKEITLKMTYYDYLVGFHGNYSTDSDNTDAFFEAWLPVPVWDTTYLDFQLLMSENINTFVIGKKNSEFEKHRLILLTIEREFENNSTRVTITVNYNLSEVHFMWNKPQEGESLISLELINNLNSIMKILIEVQDNGNDDKSYALQYNGLLNVHSLHITSLNIYCKCDQTKCKLLGSTITNGFESIVISENTFDKNSLGHLNFQIQSGDFELSAKHDFIEGEDSYLWRMTKDDKFFNGSISLFDISNGFKGKFRLESSVEQLKSVCGELSLESEPEMIVIITSIVLNGEVNYIANYNAIYKPSTVDHSLLISIPYIGYDNIRGHLGYSFLRPFVLKRLQGNITFGSNTIYMNDEGSGFWNPYSKWNIKVDFPSVLILSACQNGRNLDITAKTVLSNQVRKILLNFNVDSSGITVNMDSNNFDLNIVFKQDKGTVTAVGRLDEHNFDAFLEVVYNRINFGLTSNIPNWNNVNGHVARVNTYKYDLSLLKENREVLSLAFSEEKNEILASLSMPTLLTTDVNAVIGLSPNYTFLLKFNISGKEQTVKSWARLLSDRAQIDLITPIHGVQDLTIYFNLHRTEKAMKFVVNEKGSKFGFGISASAKSNVIEFNGNLSNGKDLYTLSIGARNGTDNDPKHTLIYFNTTKNDKSTFWLSLEGFYNLSEKVGLKISYSSIYYDQVYVELLSWKKDYEHGLLFNYIPGPDNVYFLNAKLVKHLSRPQIVIETQYGIDRHNVEISCNNSETRKAFIFNVKQNDDRFVFMQLETLVNPISSDLNFVLDNKDIIPLVNNISILNSCNFSNGSFINSTLSVNKVQYFHLFMDSHSLASVEFQSSLKSSHYIEHSYNISLVYQLYLPVAVISSDVTVNSETYKCKANLTWEDDQAATVLELSTSNGYGFENALLSAKYSAGDVYSYAIGFTVDSLTFFKFLCRIASPAEVSVELIIPDKLFLPYTREIKGEYKFTNDEMKVQIHFASGYDDLESNLRLLDTLIWFKDKHYTVDLTLLKNDSKIGPQLFQFEWLLEGDVSFKTSSVWKNDILFSAIYQVQEDVVQPKLTFLSSFLGLDKSYSWNITVPDIIELAGNLDPSDLFIYITHPSTIYHSQLGIAELVMINTFLTEKILEVHYKNTDMTELRVRHKDIFQKFLDAVENEIEIKMSRNLTVTFTDWSLSVSEDETCKSYMFGTCLKIEHYIEVRGLSGGTRSLFYELDVIAQEFKGKVSMVKKNITFGGNIDISRDNLMCSNVSMFYNSSSVENEPLLIAYITDCKSFWKGKTNLFEQDERAVHLIIEKDSSLIRLNTSVINLTYLQHLEISTELSRTHFSSIGAVGKDDFHVNLQLSDIGYSLEFQSSYKALEMLRITHLMKNSKLYFSGSVLIKGSGVSTDWVYSISQSRNGTIVGKVTGNKLDLKVILDLSNKAENQVQLKGHWNGKDHEGKGKFTYYKTNQLLFGEAVIFLNEKTYRFNAERVVKGLNQKAELKCVTPTNDYFIKVELNKQGYEENTSYASLAYKTPVQLFDAGSLNIWHSEVPLTDEVTFSVGEENAVYTLSYIEKTFGISVETKAFKMEDVKFKMMLGDRTGISIYGFAKKINAEYFYIEDETTVALKSVFEIQGFKSNILQSLNGVTSAEALMDIQNKNLVADFESPVTKNVLLVLKNVASKESENNDQIVKLSIGQKTYLNLYKSQSYVKHQLKGFFVGTVFERSLNFNYAVNDNSANIDIEYRSYNESVVKSAFFYNSVNSYNKWKITISFSVDKLFSVRDQFLIKPNVSIAVEENDENILNYQIIFTNGLSNDKYSVNGSCVLTLPSISSFLRNKSSIISARVDLDVFSLQYIVQADCLLQIKQLDVLIKWKGVDGSGVDIRDEEYKSHNLKCLKNNDSFELYLDNNKLIVSYVNNENEATISAYIDLKKLEKTVNFTAAVYYSLFVMNLSHTMFPTPCSVELKVNFEKQSLESALTILYNGFEQQAFFNVYLDSTRKYAELNYRDIWKQTHQASVRVYDENQDEITLEGKINSTALDDDFLVITIGRNSDKVELNMNDNLIFKAFKDETRILFDLHFGNDYKVFLNSEKGTEIIINSPSAKGKLLLELSKTLHNSSLKLELLTDVHKANVEVNTEKLFELNMRSDENNDLILSVELENNNITFNLQVQFDFYEHKSSVIIKHMYEPVLLIVSLNSPYFLQNDLEIKLGMRNEDVVSGTFELRKGGNLFSSYLDFNKTSHALNISIEVPLFSRMDKADVRGTFMVGSRELNVNLTTSLISDGILITTGNIYLMKNYYVFDSGLTIDSTLKDYDKVMLTFTFPRTFSFHGMKTLLLLELPSHKLYAIGSMFRLREDGFTVSGMTQWEEFLISFELRGADTSFYMNMYELSLQYKEQKLQFGAWKKPKYPITDFIYYVDLNNKRLVELLHCFIVKHNHYKTKLILNTQFEGPQKYGIDFELKTLENSTFGKVVKILGNAPQFGNDLGVDFQFSYKTLLNYNLLAQIRIPYNNEVQMARFFSVQNVQANHELPESYSKINHSFECTGLGSLGFEVEIYGQVPFIFQQEITLAAARLKVNSDIYSLNTRSFIKSDNSGQNIVLGVEITTPLEQLKQGAFNFNVRSQIVGSELNLSYNSEKLLSANVTEVSIKTKSLRVYSRWKSIDVKYLYEDDDRIGLYGYICWDVHSKQSSQIGLTAVIENNYNSYETDFELILPSEFIPKMSVKTGYEINNNRLFFKGIKIDVAGLSVDGHLARECSRNGEKSKLDFIWSLSDTSPKHISLLYESKVELDGTEYSLALQHFAIQNDIVLTTYIKQTLFGLNIQYSPLREDEITVELGYWSEDEKSGLKLLALHQSSNTLFLALANVTSTVDYTQTGVSISYLPEQVPSVVKYVNIYCRKNKKTPQVFIGVASNGNDLAVGGSLWKKESSSQGFTFEVRVNQREPIKLDVVHNRDNPGVEVDLSYGVSHSYQMFAGMPSSNEILTTISHTSYGLPTLDMQASLRLNTSKILWGNLQMPSWAQITHDIHNDIISEYSDITQVSEAIVEGFTNFAHEEFSQKVIVFMKCVSATSELLSSQTYQELQLIVDGFEAARINIVKAYNSDHLYLKTCASLLIQAGQRMYDSVACAAQVVTSLLDTLLEPVWNMCKHIYQVLDSAVSQSIASLSETGALGVTPLRDLGQVIRQYQSLKLNIHKHISQVLEKALTHVTSFQQWMAQSEVSVNRLIQRAVHTVEQQLRRLCDCADTVLAGFRVLSNTMIEMLDIVFMGIYDIKELRNMIDALQVSVIRLQIWIEHFDVHVYIGHFTAYCYRVVEMVTEDVYENFGEYLFTFKLFIEDFYNELSKLQEVQYVQIVSNNIYQKAKWFWHYAKLNDKLKHLVLDLLGNIKNNLDEWVELVIQDGDSLVYEYDPENNSFTFTQELPFEWNGFSELPHNWQSNVYTDQGQITSSVLDYSSMLQKLAQSAWIDSSLLPTFTYTAQFTLRNIFMFDGKFYYLNSRCRSYLLAGDLIHNSFSLAAVYNGQNKRDLVLFLNNVPLTIKTSLEVHMNGSLIDLPYQLDLPDSYQVSIERKVNTIVIKSERGITLECSEYLNLCKFQLSGWYFGKVAGLLGTTNNEVEHDFRSLDGQRMLTNINDFIKLWDLGSNTCGDMEESTEAAVDRVDYKCRELFFEDSSPLASCFHKVDPSQFQTMCNGPSQEDNLCASALVYVTKCAAVDVPLKMPFFCGENSQLSKKVSTSSYSDIVEVSADMSADVVFVVPEALCAVSHTDMMNFLMTALDGKLEGQKLSDINYGLVTFSPTTVQLHTFKSQLWTQDVKQLRTHIEQMLRSDKTDESQFLSALQTAASLPFRPTVSKVVVLVRCSSCPLDYELATQLLYTLRANDVTVHVVQGDMLVNKRDKPTPSVIGLDSSVAYLQTRHRKSSKSNIRLLNQVSVPQDVCSTVALRTNGTVFSVGNRRQVTVWADRVASGTIPPTPTKLCERTFWDNIVPMWKCRSIGSEDFEALSSNELVELPRGETELEYEEIDR